MTQLKMQMLLPFPYTQPQQGTLQLNSKNILKAWLCTNLNLIYPQSAYFIGLIVEVQKWAVGFWGQCWNSQSLYQFPIAAETNCHKLRGQGDTNVLVDNAEVTWVSSAEIKVVSRDIFLSVGSGKNLFLSIPSPGVCLHFLAHGLFL
jgi:hypothetical protein